VEVDSAGEIGFNAFSPSYAGGYSSSKRSNSINPPDRKSSLDANAVPLPSPVPTIRRARGRPRRQEVNAPSEASTVEPVRKLRSKQNTHKTASPDPWNNLSNSPLLTPLSPKKQRLEGTLRGLRQQRVKTINPTLPLLIADRISQGSVSGRAVRFDKNNKVNAFLPSHFSPLTGYSKAEDNISLATTVTGNIDAPAASSNVRSPLPKKEIFQKPEINNEREISNCAEHFQYISTMSSFKDSHFKHTVWKELVNNPHNSWKAFMSLTEVSVRKFAIPMILAETFTRKSLLKRIGRSL